MYGSPRFDGEAVAFWVQQLAHHDYRLSSIEAALAVLGHEAARRGLAPPRAPPAVGGALRAAARLAPRDMPQKLPLTEPLLSKVVKYTEGLADEWMVVRGKTLFYMGFYGMFRSSELVGIRWEHLHFPRRGGGMVFIPNSKTDQGGAGAWVYIPTAKGGEGPMADMVAALQQLQRDAGRQWQRFLCAPRVHDAAAEKYGDVEPPQGAHGTRARPRPLCITPTASRRRHACGGATHAALVGMSLRHIMVLGRWRSDVVRQYIYCSGSDAMAAAERMLRAEQARLAPRRGVGRRSTGGDAAH